MNPTFITFEVRTIDDAPKDGREIMVYRGDDSAVVRYVFAVPIQGTRHSYPAGFAIVHDDTVGEYGPTLFEDPTHWSPKPTLGDATERPGYVRVPTVYLSPDLKPNLNV